MEWQPIETAPKDGRIVLVYTKWNNFFVACFEEGYWCQDNNGQCILDRVDYWMPLPEPPKFFEP